ncbi:ketopantoate reductase C-terminal domain-containing protein [Listeria floridensis]|nr:ketopantoate reductase C-terminal domain-containing protein [Listeria floridensis]
MLHVTAEANQALNVADAEERVLTVCRKTAENLSSMAVDISTHRPTEIDAILLPVIEMLEEAKLKNDSLVILYELVKGMEKRNV